MNKKQNIFWHNSSVTLEEREVRNKHKGVCVWFTGLSGSGKSTIANQLQKQLFDRGLQVYLLDGDNIRHGLNNDLDFSESGRNENIRRIGEVSRLFVDAGIVVLSAFISPFKVNRNAVRQILKGRFIEVYINSDIEKCIERDPKGLYQKALKGEINDFTGINSPYEIPENPELSLNNNFPEDISKNVDSIWQYLNLHKFID